MDGPPGGRGVLRWWRPGGPGRGRRRAPRTLDPAGGGGRGMAEAAAGPTPFGAELKRRRLEAGLSHDALAERAGISARAVSDLERGVSRAPRPATLGLLADALGLAPAARAVLAAAARPAAHRGPLLGEAETPAPPGPPPDLPSGTATLLFTDLEGSTRLLEAHPAAYPEALRRHHALLRAAVEGHRGAVFE